MVFNSFEFFIFFPVVAALYLALPHRFRQGFLLAAGYYFYMCFKPVYVILLAATTTIDYLLALWIGKTQLTSQRKKAKAIFILAVLHNILLLVSFKYLSFLNEPITALLKAFHINLNLGSLELLAPIGISYFIFKKLSYLIDVYRETIKPEKNLGTFALYVSFFPEIMSGPIDRAGKLIPQFRNPVRFDYKRITDGLKLMAWGFFMKLIIADRLAPFVNKVYNQPREFEGVQLVIATVYFSIQIYCDFAGYTHIARGAGKIMGFELAQNFNRPYFSTSIGEFWKRWHMSLSNWLMDYLFLPIAYAVSRRIKSAEVLKIKAETWAYFTGIMSTMLLCGLWHGASWTFVVWGGIHGLYLAISFATKKLRKKINKKLGIKKQSDKFTPSNFFRGLATFGMVTFAWIFFKANSMADALYIVKNLLTGWTHLIHLHGISDYFTFKLLKKELIIGIFAVAVVLIVHIARKEKNFEEWLSERRTWLRWGFYLALILFLLIFGDAGAGNFIYFQF